MLVPITSGADDVMKSIKIVLLAVIAAVFYGVLHDQVTARICVEYFTIGHPPVFNTIDPTFLALGWGVIATWWVGLPLGIGMAFAAQSGSRPKVDARDLVRPIAILLLYMAGSSTLFGIIGYFAAKSGLVYLIEPMKSRVPIEKHVAFLADLWAHSAAYLTGFMGGIVLCISTWRKRRSTIDEG
jgi:hypothetical protein